MTVNRIPSCYAAQTACRVDRPRASRTPEERYDAGPSCGPYDAYVPSNLAGSPIQPPWRVLPWPRRCEPITAHRTAVLAVVKAAPGTADVSAVGRTLDVFV